MNIHLAIFLFFAGCTAATSFYGVWTIVGKLLDRATARRNKTDRRAWKASTDARRVPVERGIDRLERRFPDGVPPMRRRPSARPSNRAPQQIETFPTGEAFLADLIGACRDAAEGDRR